MRKIGLGGRASRDVFGHDPVLHHQDAVTGGQKFGQVVGNHDDAQPLRRQIANDVVNVGLRSDINPDARPVQHKHTRAARQPPRKDDALLVAP